MKTPVLSRQPAEYFIGMPTRRDALRALALTGASILLTPLLRASTASWSTSSDYSPAIWKERLTIFLSDVLPGDARGTVVERVKAAPCTTGIVQAFHDQFSSPVRLYLRLAPMATLFEDVTLEIDQLPYYDRQNPCRRTKDLNAAEMARIIEPSERQFYGCVLSPCSERRSLTAQDRQLFQRTTHDYPGVTTDDYSPEYVRNYTNGKASFLGWGATRTSWGQPSLPAKNVFLSSFDVS